VALEAHAGGSVRSECSKTGWTSRALSAMRPRVLRLCSFVGGPSGSAGLRYVSRFCSSRIGPSAILAIEHFSCCLPLARISAKANISSPTLTFTAEAYNKIVGGETSYNVTTRLIHDYSAVMFIETYVFCVDPNASRYQTNRIHDAR
jgi:hypothetical protein